MPTDCTDLHRLEITVVLCDEQSARNEAYPMNQNKKGSGPKNQKGISKSRNRSVPNRSVSAPVAQAKVITTNKQKMSYLPNGDCIITHREYLQDIAGSVAFTAVSVPVQPGLVASAPWLSAIAQRYESYQFESLSYLYETEQATSATGTLALVLDYDASDTGPSSKTQALSYRSSVRSAPWAPCRLTAASEDLHKRKTYFVRNGANPANTDIKLYDVGNLFICTIGQANTNTLGELYIEYRIRLMTPQMSDAGLGEALSSLYTGTTNAAPYVYLQGNAPVNVVSTGTTTSLTTLTFTQPMEGIITTYTVGTTLAVTTLGGTGQISQSSEVINGANTQRSLIAFFKATPGQTVTISQPNATISSSTATIGQFDNGY
jgi:hypothetical protein